MAEPATIPDVEKKRLALEQIYAAVFGTPDGEIVLRDLLKEGGVLEADPVGGEEALYRRGKCSLALHVLDMLRHGEAQLAAMARARQLPELPRAAADSDNEGES